MNHIEVKPEPQGAVPPELVPGQALQPRVFSVSYLFASTSPLTLPSSRPPLRDSLPSTLLFIEPLAPHFFRFLFRWPKYPPPLLSIPFFGWGMPFSCRNGPKRCLGLYSEKMDDPRAELHPLDESGNRLFGGKRNTLFFLLTYILILLCSLPLSRNEFIFIWQFYDPNQPALSIYLI